MSTLRLIDCSGLFYAAWFASADQPLGHAYETTVGRVRRWAAEGGITVLCCDGPNNRASRLAISADYKATREKADPAMLEQMHRVIETLGGDGLHVLHADGKEADDVIATMCRWARRSESPFESVAIVSDDKDLAACVGGGVTLYRPREGVEYNGAGVMDKWGVGPRQMGDLLALCGDRSDNIQGVKGIGHKTGVALLGAFHSIDGIHKALLGNGAHRLFTPTRLKNLQAAFADDPNGSIIDVARRLVALDSHALIDEECAVVLTTKAPVKLDQKEWEDDMGDEQMRLDDVLDDDERAAIENEPLTEAEKKQAGSVSPTNTAEAALTCGDLLRNADPEPPASQPRAMVHQPPDWRTSLEPRTAKEAWKMAQSAMESRLFSAYANADAAFLVILAGRELGQGVMASLRSFHVIDGKPSPSAQLLAAMVLGHPTCKVFRLLKADNESATMLVQRKDWAEPIEWTFTIADAERAGLLVKTNWRQYPRAMLGNRVMSEAAHMHFPDACANLYIPDELGVDGEAAQ